MQFSSRLLLLGKEVLISKKSRKIIELKSDDPLLYKNSPSWIVLWFSTVKSHHQYGVEITYQTHLFVRLACNIISVELLLLQNISSKVIRH
jgi:hypothetical protein